MPTGYKLEGGGKGECVCVCVFGEPPTFFFMWDLLGLQLIGDKVQGGEKGEGIKDGVSLE